MQFRAQAHEVGGIARVESFAADAGTERFAQLPLRHHLIDRIEHGTLAECPVETLEQHVGGERLQDVIGRRQFGSTHDLVDHPLGSHDEVDGCCTDQLVMTQIFQQLLAILTVAEVVFADDDVNRLLL